MFIFLEKDTFEARSQTTGSETRTSQTKLGETAPIRRPYRGIQIKDDTYAVLSVRKPNGEAIPLASSSAVDPAGAAGWAGYTSGGLGQVDEYSDFILQQVNDQRMEKQQIIETFGDAFVYFFGERPRMVTFSGQLVNTSDFNWRAQFWHNYENYLRGSRLVQLNARCYLAYDTIVIEGYPISATAVDDSENPYQVSFQMTMLMTDYHEYSTIGETRFPGGAGAENLEILNQELEESRKSFVSTTAEVRRANLSGGTSNQLPSTNSALALLRSGISAANSSSSWLGDKLQTANNLLGGRVMRIPIGAASFLQLANEGQVASASITTSSMVGFDAATGERFGTITVNGVTIPGNKLLIMGPSKFAPSWVSKVTGTSRGYIYENRDEYPTRTQAPSLGKLSLADLLTESQYSKVLSRSAGRVATMSDFQESLSVYNVFAANGNVLSTIASVVSMVRQGYGMLLTSANAIRDPVGAVTSVLGVTPQNVKKIGEGLGDGAFVPGVSMFVGGAARRTWESWFAGVQNRFSSLGAVFGGFEYQSKSSTDPDNRDYEAAYGGSDYTPLIQAAKAAEERALAAGTESVGAGQAAAIGQTLDEVYGNTDSASSGSGSDDPTTLEAVYGQEGSIQDTQANSNERAKMMQEANNGSAPPNDTDTSGITASNADSAPINPIV